jgi:phosphoglycolate phosphatase-like HAD superfamily hydrolase
MAARLVLWDIDRTLVFAGGVDKAVWLEVCTELAGRPVTKLGQTSGRTDPQILRDAFRLAGLDEDAANRLLPTALRMEGERLAARRADLAAKGHPMPGAADALAALDAIPGVVQSVLTGNVAANAALKLATFGLDRFIDFEVGAYGSDDSDRPALVRLARQRAKARLGVTVDSSTTVIVGDSLRDVQAGQVGGARVVAVATGRTDAATLAEAGAQVVLADLTDTDAVLRAILAHEPVASRRDG